MQNKQKFQFALLLILISFLGISIFALYSNDSVTDEESMEAEKRVVFKENGVSEDFLYASNKKSRKESPETLNKLNILNDDVSWLDGLSLDLGGKKKIPLAVVIENHPASRPQMAGLNQAKIVYEFLVEGGITRYLAVFDPTTVSKIGPVRSARPYSIHWAEEFGGVFTHVGGSDEAMAYLRNSSRILNIDENEGEEILWRDADYLAPHDAFTNTKNMYAKADEWEWKKQIDESFFKFKTKEFPAKDPIKSITIDFSFPSYKVDWTYNVEENSYWRYLADVKQEGISAKNIIVQVLPNQVIAGDEKGRLSMPVIGSGVAIYFLDGEKKAGTWKKSDYGEKTIFYDKEKKEMRFNKGNTWIEVVDVAYKVTSK